MRQRTTTVSFFRFASTWTRQPLTVWMSCSHEGFRTVCSSYDREQAVLVFYWMCERCGTRLHEASRTAYRPRFDPLGIKRAIKGAR
jgi:hypothetical protein